jgi:hypothetical protein
MENIECRGYGVSLSPWNCIENQVSLYCLPGWPCETCETAVCLGTAGGDAGATGDARPTRKKLPAWLKNASAAVRRDWLREHQG